MKYLLGSGFVHRPNASAAESMFTLWLANIHKYARPLPDRIVVVCVGGAVPTVITDDVDVIQLSGNLGHGHQLLHHPHPSAEQPPKMNKYSGWSGAFLSTAMLAYCNESDFLWQESDCLGFGDYVGQMYREIGESSCMFGGPMTSRPYMPSSQSMVLMKHAIIPDFVREYLSLGSELHPQHMVEHKFSQIEKKWVEDNPERGFKRAPTCRRLSPTFVDRMRPIPYDAPVFSAQQWTVAELDELRRRGLI